MTISGRVEESTASGGYACKFVQAPDAMEDYRTFHPDPDFRFRVENGPGDRERTAALRLAILGLPGTPRPWWRLLGG